MPIYNPVITHLNIEEIRRYAGLAKCKDFSLSMLEHARNEALLLSQFKGIWQLYDYKADTGTIMSPVPLSLDSEKLIAHLSDCTQVVIIAVTIGPNLESAIQEHFDKGDYTHALLLDAAATTMVETGADLLEGYIKSLAQRKGCSTRWRFSPGYGHWDVRIQPEIVKLAQGDSIQLKTTDSCMLVPRKSVTAIIGWSPAVKDEVPCKKSCQDCGQKNCVSRKE